MFDNFLTYYFAILNLNLYFCRFHRNATFIGVYSSKKLYTTKYIQNKKK